jgi:hypothetical protein
LPSSPISLNVLATPPLPTTAVPNRSAAPTTAAMEYGRTYDASQVSFSGLNEPCSIGSIVEVVVSHFKQDSFLRNFIVKSALI